MATLVINCSGGNLHMDSIGVVLPPGGRKEFACTENELMSLCHEMRSFKVRGRVRIIEDAEIVPSSPPPAPVAPSATEPVEMQSAEQSEPALTDEAALTTEIAPMMGIESAPTAESKRKKNKKADA